MTIAFYECVKCGKRFSIVNPESQLVACPYCSAPRDRLIRLPEYRKKEEEKIPHKNKIQSSG